MKRSTMQLRIAEFLQSWCGENWDYNYTVADQLLGMLEREDMFYCPVEKLGSLGTLRTPKGWDYDEPEQQADGITDVPDFCPFCGPQKCGQPHCPYTKENK